MVELKYDSIDFKKLKTFKIVLKFYKFLTQLKCVIICISKVIHCVSF